MTYWQIRDTAERLRDLPLRLVMEASSARRDPNEKAKWLTPVGRISVSGAKFYNFTLNVGGGGAIDLAMHLHGLEFKEAVFWLNERFPAPMPRLHLKSTSPEPPISLRPWPMEPILRRAMRMPGRDDRKLFRVRGYLTEKRGLPAPLIEHLIGSRKIYADARANAVFVLRAPDRRPIGAELKGTTDVSWCGLAPGSRKDAGYFAVHARDAKAFVLCESAIDAISCFTLDQTRYCISTAGVRSNPAWLDSLVSNGYQVFCAFDADPAGDRAAKNMIEKHPAIKRLRPGKKDWNDLLLSASR